MKKKRFFVIALLVFWMASAVTVCAGVKSRIIEDKYVDMRLYGSISFEEKSLWFQDVITYSARVSGTDFDLLVEDKKGYEVYVMPRSDKKIIGKIELSEDVRSVYASSVKCGKDCAYGKLIMVCFTVSNELVSFDND